jgi:membrane AbrB-like protein
MAEEAGADVRRVAIIQMIRLVALLVFLPSVFAFFGYVGDVADSPVAQRELIPSDVAILIVCAVAGAVLLEWLRMPAGVMFGSMIAGAALFATGAVTTGLPEWMMLPGFAVIGATVGANFQGTDRRLFVGTLAAGIGSVFVGSLASMLTALPFSYLTGLPLAQLWLAYAPGGVDAMSVLALAIGLEPAFVAMHHLTRFFALGVFLPLWLRPRIRAERAKNG